MFLSMFIDPICVLSKKKNESFLFVGFASFWQSDFLES